MEEDACCPATETTLFRFLGFRGVFSQGPRSSPTAPPAPGILTGNAGWPPPLVEEPEARQGEQLGAMEHSPDGTGFKTLQHRRMSAGDMMDPESLCAGEGPRATSDEIMVIVNRRRMVLRMMTRTMALMVMVMTMMMMTMMTVMRRRWRWRRMMRMTVMAVMMMMMMMMMMMAITVITMMMMRTSGGNGGGGGGGGDEDKDRRPAWLSRPA